jgi:hypothetical protein
MNHFSNDYIDAYISAREVLKESITGCQDIIKLCQLANVPKMCSIDVNRGIILADEGIYQCEQISDHCKKHLNHCKDPSCMRICNELILLCQEAIKGFEGIELECKDAQKQDCIDSINQCINNSSKIILLIDDMLKI